MESHKERWGMGRKGSPVYTGIAVDVGANRGNTVHKFLQAGAIHVHAFEPNTKLCRVLRKRFPFSSLVSIYEMAVSDVDGDQDFFINKADAASSLKPLTDDPKGHGNFGIESVISVPTIRLDTFMKKADIAQIDALKIDAQGSDLDVLRSLGDRIRDVKQIMVEAFTGSDDWQYVDEVKEDSVKEFMAEAGFRQVQEIRRPHNIWLDMVFTQ